GNNWSAVGGEFNARVLALGTHNGSLVAGGEFTDMEITGTIPTVKYAAIFNGTSWVQAAEQLDAPARVLLDVDGTLYAGGDLYNDASMATFGLAQLTSGSYWTYLLSDHANYMYNDGTGAWITSLLDDDGSLYLGGKFNVSPMLGTYGTNLAHYNGPNSLTAMIVLEAPINGLAHFNQQLIIGGDFSASLPHVAVLDLSSGILDRGALHVEVMPNPASDELRVQLPAASSVAPVIFDASGRTVQLPMERTSTSYRINVRSLASGSYVVQANTPTGVATARFVKE
ncbi:MAG TPA: T9SS type A sorting domain-containing protein, partial [Flavobacteriales bacterium]|nr:T9SS type A sorting domain-containing protein [Flavobacteriales bacterium]